MKPSAPIGPRARVYRDRPELCAAARKFLRKVGFQRVGDALVELFAFPDLCLAKFRPLLAVWRVVTLASFATPALLGAMAFLYIVIPIAFFNLFLYVKTTGQISVHAPSLYYIGLMAGFCGKMRRLRAFGESEKMARHPLVDSCVPVSFAFDRGVILTGTNMSGKSTFLRTLGINQVLATNLGLAYADHFETDLFFVSSSIRSGDDRAAGKSRYLAEAERLLSIIGAVRAADPPVLALIDEILNGTNSKDRIAASIAIVKGAAGKDSIVVAATHDLEIAEALRGAYAPYFFSERIDEGRLVFDYALREGIVDRKNALRLLRLIGFGDDILGDSLGS